MTTTLGIYGLTIGYVLLAVLLLSVNLHSKWSWPVKAGAIVITTVFYIASYLSLPPLLGWATEQQLPAKFRLLAAHVQQPDKLAGTKGTISLWVTDARDLAEMALPRAYEVPYSDALHTVVINATAKLGQGVAQLGGFVDPADPNFRIVQDATRQGQVSSPIEFFDMPDPMYPDK